MAMVDFCQEVSAGTKHLPRLTYIMFYQPFAFAIKVYALSVYYPDFGYTDWALARQYLSISLGFMGCGLLAGIYWRDKISEFAFYIWEDPRHSNRFLKGQTYGILVFCLAPTLLLGSFRLLTQILAVNVTGFYTIYAPLLDDANTLWVLFAVYTMLLLSRVVTEPSPVQKFSRLVLLNNVPACPRKHAELFTIACGFGDYVRAVFPKPQNSMTF